MFIRITRLTLHDQTLCTFSVGTEKNLSGIAKNEKKLKISQASFLNLAEVSHFHHVEVLIV